MNVYELEQTLIGLVGETKEDTWAEWWESYTGLNGFYHLLAGVDHGYTTNEVADKVTVVSDGVVEVKGLGTFTRVEVFESNFDTYEKSWDNYLIFKFQDKLYRVEGHLDSHMGGVWDGSLEEVEPVEVTKIEYRSV